MPTCSIVVPVYNRASLTRQCLDALLTYLPTEYPVEIIVVDDASTDSTPALLASYGDRVRVVTHAVNTGYSRACNDGAAVATGDYLVFLNNDVLPQVGWLDALVRYAETHPAAGIVGAKLLYADGTIEHAGMVIGYDSIPRVLYAGFPADHPAVNRSRRFQVVTGACMLVRRDCFAALGGFDPQLTHYYEDVDLCLRAGQLGYEVHYCHESVLVHLTSVSEGRLADGVVNQQRFLARWAGRIEPDEMRYYVEDSLLQVRYPALYPLEFEVSPLLAAISPASRDAGPLLRRRAEHVYRLLTENTRLKVELQELSARLHALRAPAPGAPAGPALTRNGHTANEARASGPLCVLLTNYQLAERTGSELYVRDVALALRLRGHRPLVFSPVLGPVAHELAAQGVPVVSDLDRLPAVPDLIHGQHHVPTMLALLHCPGVPAVYFCHGVQPWQERPPRFPRIVRYVAVGEPTLEHVLQTCAVPAEQVDLILNFVDLDRFRPRPPLPSRPRRALVFNNHASERTFLPAIREACARLGVVVDAIGLGVGAPVAAPERLLPQYDLVFAVGRAALEAMAVGAAVVLCGPEGLGPLVSRAEFARLRAYNFGYRTLTRPHTPEAIVAEIARYDAAEAAAVSAEVRATAGLDRAIEQIEATYWRALADYARLGYPPTGEAELRTVAGYLRWLLPYLTPR